MTIEANAYVTLEDIDDAFISRFQVNFVNNKMYSSILTVDSNPVRFFLGYKPLSAYVQDEVFPCLAVTMKGNPRPDRTRAFGGIHTKTISEDLKSGTPNRVIANGPIPYKVNYLIHTFSRKVRTDRDMTTFMQSNFGINDSLNINSNNWWMFLEDSSSLDETFRDQVIHHKVWDYRLEVDMPGPDSERTIPVVTNTNIQTEII